MSAAIESLSPLRDEKGRARLAGLPASALSERLSALHRDGLASFDDQGIPTRQLERWKGTSLARLESMAFARIGGSGESNISVTEAKAEADLLLVDGVVRSIGAEATRLPGLRVLSLSQAASEEPELVARHLGRLADPKTDALVALQSALFEDVAVLVLAANTRLERPIRIRSITTSVSSEEAAASFPRLLVVGGRGCEATIAIDSRSDSRSDSQSDSRSSSGSRTDSAGPAFTNLVAEFVIEAGARIEFVEVQAPEASRIHVTQAFTEVARDGHFASRVFTLGQGLVRSELAIRMIESGAATEMHGLFLGQSEGHLDHYTTVEHAAERCTSNEHYRGVLGDRSKGVFRGRVIVHPGAQKTDARQSNPNLLLSDGATIDTKPQLEIYADDVKASHGSTIGQLDPDALFFLRARGIDAHEARLVLTRAFASEIVDVLGDSDLRREVGQRVEQALAGLNADEAAEPPEKRR